MHFDKPGRIFEADAIESSLTKIGDRILAEFKDRSQELLFLGIQRRGVPFARRLSEYIQKKSGFEIPVGTLDITMYRDDIGMRKVLPVIHETCITDFGRPAIIRLAVLFDRGCHEFPIAADYVGEAVEIPDGFKISVHWMEIDGADFVKILEKKIWR